MTSSLRRKRQTTARRITPSRAISSLLGLAWLAAGPAAADPPAPLHLLPGTAVQVALPEPPPLMPLVRPSLPDESPPKSVAATKTLYYQKDAAKPAAQAESVRPAKYQDPVAQNPVPGETTLPPSATNTTPPKITDIPMQSEAQL